MVELPPRLIDQLVRNRVIESIQVLCELIPMQKILSELNRTSAVYRRPKRRRRSQNRLFRSSGY